MAISFANAGASYIAAGARSDLTKLGQDIEAAAASANRPKPKLLLLKLDVTDQQSVQEAADSVRREFGKMDIVISNAGGLTNKATVTESDPEVWWGDYILNLKGPFLISRAFIPLLLEGEMKTLVFNASAGAHLAMPGASAYQGAKAATLRLCAHIDAEYSEKGLITFCVHPGNVPTDAVGGIDGLPDHLKPGKIRAVRAKMLIFIFRTLT